MSQGISKPQLAENLYGREEMLALFDISSSNLPPKSPELSMVYNEKPQTPLALQRMSEEETRLWNQGINSDTIIRITRGRGSTSARGRVGRGGYHYNTTRPEGRRGSPMNRGPRGPFDSLNSLRYFTNKRNLNRNGEYSNDWRRRDDSNWCRKNRIGAHQGQSDESNGRWGRTRSGSWRPARRPTSKYGEGRDRGETRWSNNSSGHERRTLDRGETLPEWAVDNPGEKGGSVDSSGTFHYDDHNYIIGNGQIQEKQPDYDDNVESSNIAPTEDKQQLNGQGKEGLNANANHLYDIWDDEEEALVSRITSDNKIGPSSHTPLTNNKFGDLQGEVQDLYDMWDAEEEALVSRITSENYKIGPSSHTPLTNDKWYFGNLQGEVQGPFLTTVMAEWYSLGYFHNHMLMVKRACDEYFYTLGDLVRLKGNVPFCDTPFSEQDVKSSGRIGVQPTPTHNPLTLLLQEQQLQHYLQYQQIFLIKQKNEQLQKRMAEKQELEKAKKKEEVRRIEEHKKKLKEDAEKKKLEEVKRRDDEKKLKEKKEKRRLEEKIKEEEKRLREEEKKRKAELKIKGEQKKDLKGKEDTMKKNQKKIQDEPQKSKNKKRNKMVPIDNKLLGFNVVGSKRNNIK